MLLRCPAATILFCDLLTVALSQPQQQKLVHVVQNQQNYKRLSILNEFRVYQSFIIPPDTQRCFSFRSSLFDNGVSWLVRFATSLHENPSTSTSKLQELGPLKDAVNCLTKTLVTDTDLYLMI